MNMGKILDYDGPFMRTVNRFSRLMWLGVLTLLFCVPIVTVGASITAMYYVVFQMRDGDKGYVWNNFWRGFKENFLQSTLLWSFWVVAYCVLYGDYVILTKSIYSFPIPFKVVAGMFAFMFVMAYAFVFPLQARFENTWKQILKNSFLMGLFHLPKTILVVFLHAVPFAILYLYPAVFPAVLVLGLSAPAYLNAAVLLSIFRIYSPSEKTVDDEIEQFVNRSEEV